MERLLRPREAAKMLGISVRWLQEMDRRGDIVCSRTLGGRRRIPLSEVQRLMGELEVRVPVLYARVSSHDQKSDLRRQKERLLNAHPGAEIYEDIRSGLKFDRKGFLELYKAIQQKRVSTVTVTHKDRLARFGFDLIERIFGDYGTTIEILEKDEEGQTPEAELAKDLIAIITSFSARLYGLRSHKTKKLIQTAREVVRDDENNK